MATLALQPCGPQLEAAQFERMSQAIEDLGCRLDRIEGLLFLSDFEHFQKLDALIRNCKEAVHGSLADASEANTHIELAETKDTEDVLPRPAIEEAKVFEASSASSEPPAQQMCSDVHRNLASAMLAKQQLQQLPRSSVSSKKQKKQQRKQQLQEEADSSNATPQRGDCVSHQLIEATVRNVQRDNDQKAMEAKCREATALQECMRSGEAAKKSRRKPQLMTIPGNRPVGFSADSGTGEAQQQEEHQDSKNLLLGRADDAKKFRFKPQLMTIPGNRAVGSMENSGEKDDPSGKSSGILQAQLAWSHAALQDSSLESQKPTALHCQRSMLNFSDFTESGDGDAGVILECFGGKGAGLSWKGKGAGLPLALSRAAEPGSETI